MTVWIVTLNWHVWDVYASRELAEAGIAELKALPKFRGETWRPVGTDGWASRSVTYLGMTPCVVKESHGDLSVSPNAPAACGV